MSTAPLNILQKAPKAPSKRSGWKSRLLTGVAALGLGTAAVAPKAQAWAPDAVGVQVYAIDERGNPIGGDAVELVPAFPVNPADYKTFALTDASGLDSLYLPPGQALTLNAGKVGYLGVHIGGRWPGDNIVADGSFQRVQLIQPVQYNALHNILTLSDVAELKEGKIFAWPVDNSWSFPSWEDYGRIYVQFDNLTGTWTSTEKDQVARKLGIGNRSVDRSQSLAAGLEADSNPGWSGMYWEVPLVDGDAVKGIKIRRGPPASGSLGTYTANGREYVGVGIVTITGSDGLNSYGKEFWQALGWNNVNYSPTCLREGGSDPTPRDYRFTSIIYNVRRRLREADVDVSGVPTLCNAMRDWTVDQTISVQPRSWSQVKDLYRR